MITPKRIIDYFIDNTRLVNIITLVLIVGGLVALYYTKKDLHPPFKFNYVTINATLESASSEEVERLVTYPVEETLQGIPDVEEIHSRSRTGAMTIWVKFPQSVKNLSEKIEIIRGRVQVALRDLPSDLRDVEVEQAADSQIFLASLGVTGIDPKNIEHHRFIDLFRNKLKGVPGVSVIESSLRPLQIYVRFDAKKLAEYNLTVSQIRSLIRSEYDPAAIGYNSVSGREWLLEYSGNTVTPEKISAIPIFRNIGGQKLTLADVAEVKYDFERSDRYHFLLNGKPAVELVVMKSPENDSMVVFEGVQKVLAEIEKPKGVAILGMGDGPYFINQQISVLLNNGFGGLVLVLLMLAWAMSGKTSLMTALGLPISYFGTFLILKYYGMSIDLITMIAMILVVGNLVDDAVIFAERYNQLLTEGIVPKEAASKAALELIVPVTGTIMTIICAFAPIVMLDSELGVIFQAIPIVVTAALLLSWFETFFILPNHLAHYVKTPPRERSLAFFNRVARYYKFILGHTLRFRYAYGFGAAVLLGYSLYVASKMPQDFSISVNSPQVEIFTIFKEEHTFEKIEELLAPLHADLKKAGGKKVDFIETNIGWVRRDGRIYRGPRYATIRLMLDRTDSNTKALKAETFKRAEAVIAKFKIPEIKEIEAVVNERGAGERRKNMTSIEIEGRDDRAFRAAREELITAIPNHGPVQEYIPPDNHGPLTYQFLPLVDIMRLHEFSRRDLAFQIQAQTGSVELLRSREGGRWFKVMLEPKGLQEPKLADLQNISIQAPKHGEELPLKNLGSWKEVGFTDSVEHKKGERTLTLDYRFDGTKTNEKVAQEHLKEFIVPFQKKYNTLQIKVVDANEQDKKGREWTGKIVLMAGILIYLILAIALRSFLQPLIVGLPIPFALIGVVWALKLHGLPLGMMTMIGLIGTMGVAVNDSIVMVDHINRLWREKGRRTMDLVIDGAASRIRAICLTASCTLVGVFPTAYGLGGESGFTQPLAFSMGWGLTASLCLTLFIIPSMLMVLEDVRNLPGKIYRWRKGQTAVAVTGMPEFIPDAIPESNPEAPLRERQL